MIKARVVLNNFEVKHLLVDIAQSDGKKTALDKSRILAESLKRFAGNEQVLDVLKTKTQARIMLSDKPKMKIMIDQ